jgi:hypothetical protein
MPEDRGRRRREFHVDALGFLIYTGGMKKFNTAGPCDPQRHYMVPAEPRLPEARGLVADYSYFVVHAPRQTGKTTTLRELARALTAEGKFAALHFSCEAGEPAGDDYAAAQSAILDSIRVTSRQYLPGELQPPAPWPDAGPTMKLNLALAEWAGHCPRPLVLFMDEIDALRGESLRSVLRQLRSGFPSRPNGFPASVVLCGLRDVRDYKAASGGDPSRLGTASPFNVKVKSLRIGAFAEQEVAELYLQHTAETGQPFTSEALARAFELTAGQPWLVNALAREIVEEIRVPAAEPITVEHMEEAKERLILARQTHLDSLVDKLREPRVRRLLEPLMSGDATLNSLADRAGPYLDDLQYASDLGIVAPKPPLRVANPIYKEVFTRVLAVEAEYNVVMDERAFVLPDGRLDMPRLLEEFLGFWKQHGEVLAARMDYHEVAPQLVLMAFLQRVVNGGGYIDREYGVGRGRIDLLVRWPYPGADDRRAWQREALELKVWTDKRPDPLDEGLRQLEGYLERLGLPTGVLVIFDRRKRAPNVARRTRLLPAQTPAGRAVTLVRA